MDFCSRVIDDAIEYAAAKLGCGLRLEISVEGRIARISQGNIASRYKPCVSPVQVIHMILVCRCKNT